jgi:hypothetical protein
MITGVNDSRTLLTSFTIYECEAPSAGDSKNKRWIFPDHKLCCVTSIVSVQAKAETGTNEKHIACGSGNRGECVTLPWYDPKENPRGHESHQKQSAQCEDSDLVEVHWAAPVDDAL